MFVNRIFFCLALLFALGATSHGTSWAAEDKADTKSDKPKAEAKDKTAPEEKPAEADPFKVPDGGVKELLAFIKETINYRPMNAIEAAKFRLKGIPALKEAAKKVLETATPEDRQLEGFADVESLLFLFRAGDLRPGPSTDRQELIAELKNYFANSQNPSKYAVSAASQVASGLEFGGSAERAAEVYRELGATIAQSKDPAVAKMGVKMEGAARRLTLVGNAMEVSGTEMDGKSFDWAKLRGKVVLVDFWATWCGPCRAELPNVKRNYELYHDKGFEVVAISLDQDRAALEAFLEKEQNPWITLHDGSWDENTVATHYGVMGIPTVILVDQDGKVVSTRARGPELGKQLEKLLGPAEPKAPDEKDKPAEKDKPDAAAK